MAQRTTVVLTDDVDGGEASETVRFGFEGTHYEIDLSATNAEKLRRALAPYVEHGRRVSGRRAAAGTSSSAGSSASRPADDADAVDGAAVRAWARENGIEVSDRGRIKSEVVERYKQAAG
ncbi:histone-like nucleoid-structuring protein Lsr2 [Kineococcus indalonis]|uniref:histone-like nucleoid-structuring protein Lsr2 n=1 Tax=Kineococcus indalonis TaxID=2696566 RepID=UPI001412813A|nr:Lsr2 family protein [Kineococcus indalonis]NAZ86821.1 Lsr2 family protein [Kineococcus indalonis]